jgi:tetratricopeptide (TPR) repeat protein
MFRWVALVVVAWSCLGTVGHAADEGAWEIRGEYVSLKKGDATLVVLRTSDGLIEVPLSAFSEAGRAAIEALAAGDKSPKPAPGDLPKAVAEDLAACTTAAEVIDLCTLLLSDTSLSVAARRAIESRHAEFIGRANRGEVRFGDTWASPEVARQATEKAAEHLREAAEMMRLGNIKLVDEELHKASRADPSGGQADFVMGLSYMLRTRPDYDAAKAAFREVIRRQPANGQAWNNLAVCEAQQRDYQRAVEAFRSAADALANSESVISNLAILITFAADRRSRISSKELDAIRSLYNELNRGRGAAAPVAAAGGPVVLSPAGMPVVAGGLNDLSSLLSPPASSTAAAGADFVGVVVAPDAVLCLLPPERTAGTGGLVVPMADGRNLPAQRVATMPGAPVVLLKCEGLGITPLPLAATPPKHGASVTAIEPVIGGGGPESGAVSAGLPATALASPVSPVDRPRFVIDIGGGVMTTVFGPGTLVIDDAGKLAGLGAQQPLASRTTGSRRLAIPIDAVWKLMTQLDQSIAPKPDKGDSGKLVAAEVASRMQAAIVRVRTAP